MVKDTKAPRENATACQDLKEICVNVLLLARTIALTIVPAIVKLSGNGSCLNGFCRCM